MMRVTKRIPSCFNSAFLALINECQCLLNPSIIFYPLSVSMFSGLARKKMLSSRGAGAEGKIIAVNDEKEISKELLGKT